MFQSDRVPDRVSRKIPSGSLKGIRSKGVADNISWKLSKDSFAVGDILSAHFF